MRSTSFSLRWSTPSRWNQPSTKLLPLDPDVFPEFEANRDSYNRDVTYVPSVRAVMNRLVPGYIKGDIFGALVESYCSEQNARMTAMKSSSDNARAMLQTLNLSYNRARSPPSPRRSPRWWAAPRRRCDPDGDDVPAGSGAKRLCL